MNSPRAVLPHLTASEGAVLAAARAMPPEEYSAPSLLPRWSRADVLAHLALNAEGLARAVAGSTTVYDSDERRDADIAELGAAGPDAIAARLDAAVSRLTDVLAAAPYDDPDARVERTPGSDLWFTVESVPFRRWCEVEIHHADLGLGHRADDWPEAFAIALLDARTSRGNWTDDFVARARDLDREWRFGEPAADAPTVTGTAGALGWWLTGRGSGNLTSSTGTLPAITGF